MEPLISVIIPIYNVEPYLARCVESILGQTYRNLEVILVDDGSTDGSSALCDGYGARDRRVCVFHQKNRGAAAARNTGLNAASGDLIAFVDSDDEIAPTMYERLAAALDHSGGAAAICVFSGASLPPTGDWRKLWLSLLQGDLLMASLCNKLYRREAWEGLRLDPDIRFTEDLWANVQLFSRHPGAVLVPEPLYHYKSRNDSAMCTPLTEGHFDALTVSDRLGELVRGDPEAEDCALRQRTLIELSLVNRILRSGLFQERYDPLRRSLLERKKEILHSPRSTAKERWSLRLLDKFPGLYRRAVLILR